MQETAASQHSQQQDSSVDLRPAVRCTEKLRAGYATVVGKQTNTFSQLVR